MDGLLFWCNGGAKLPLELAVNGTTDEPFFLVSLASPIPNLNAIPIKMTDVKTNKVHCLHNTTILEECNAGKRKDLSVLEKLMKKYGL